MPVPGCVWRLLPFPHTRVLVLPARVFLVCPLGVCPAHGYLFPSVAVVAIVCCVFGMAGFLDVRCPWFVTASP